MNWSPPLPQIRKIMWAVFLVTLPVTSFPHFPGFMGKSVLVRPLALYPLFGLIILVTLPRFLTKSLPLTIVPFLAFLGFAIFSTIFAFTRGIESNLAISVEGRAVRTLITLVLGSLFYLTVALFPKSEEDLRFSLIWLYIGFAIALLWGSFQVVYILKFNRQYFTFLNEIQHIFSARKLFTKRISGLTYEPSWFAEQITFLLMPWLFSAVISKISVFRWRFRWVTVELILLGWAAVVLLFTYSRGGLALFTILVVLSWFMRPRAKSGQQNFNYRSFVKRLAQIGLILIVLIAIVYIVGQQNQYFARLWGYWTDEEAEGTFLYYIAFDQRFILWETAYRVFADHPILGVGLGNFTFFFDEYLPDRQYKNPEIFLKLVPDIGRNLIVTAKNLFVRLLAETGIVGTATFISFLVAILGCSINLYLSPDQNVRFWGRAGILGLVAFLVVTFSVDSFAIPNMWVVFGLITASAQIFPPDDRLIKTS
jgi:O-antigen ligase